MQKTILITGSTDGIGLETAKLLLKEGHRVLLHGRNPEKLKKVAQELSALSDKKLITSYVADLSKIEEVVALGSSITKDHDTFDALINNAGVFKASNPKAPNGLDIRFVVNTIAPYLLTQLLLPLLGSSGRIVNLSSAAQSSVDLKALSGEGGELPAMEAYSQSKLAITMWSRAMARSLGDNGPAVIAVNPGSLLASKMVQEGFGVAGNDIGIGAEILLRAAISDEFADASGKYFDNDARQFAAPHPDALDEEKCDRVVEAIENVLKKSNHHEALNQGLS